MLVKSEIELVTSHEKCVRQTVRTITLQLLVTLLIRGAWIMNEMKGVCRFLDKGTCVLCLCLTSSSYLSVLLLNATCLLYTRIGKAGDPHEAINSPIA